MSKAFCDRIGVTRVVNPGSDKRTPHLVLIELQNLDTMEHSIYARQRT
jgi:Icc-related predicted phosphoesterase